MKTIPGVQLLLLHLHFTTILVINWHLEILRVPARCMQDILTSTLMTATSKAMGSWCGEVNRLVVQAEETKAGLVQEHGLHDRRGGTGGGNSPFYLIDPEEMDALRAAVGGTSAINIGIGSTRLNTPRLVINYRASNASPFDFIQYNIDGTAKEYLRRGGTNLASIVCPIKISVGQYSKLYIKLFIMSKSSEPRVVMGLGRNFAFGGSGDFTMNLLSDTVVDNSTIMDTIIEKTVDISSINEDFYFGLYTYDTTVYFRGFCLIP